MGQGRCEDLALIVTASGSSSETEGDRNEHRPGRRTLEEPYHDGRHVAADAGESLVLQRMDGAPGAAIQPHRRADRLELCRPLAAQAAGAEMRLRLPAAFAPWPAHRAPAQPAHRAHDVVDELGTEEAVADETFRGQEQLLEGVEESGHPGSLKRRPP